MFGKKRLANQMIEGVDTIKLILYKVLSEEFSLKYQDKDEDFYKTLAGATVNEIFGSHNEKSKSIYIDNKKTIIEEIKYFSINYPDLKQPITDALRVAVQANFMLSGNFPDNYLEIFEKATERNIFIKGGNKPEPNTFLKTTSILAQKYNLH